MGSLFIGSGGLRRERGRCGCSSTRRRERRFRGRYRCRLRHPCHRRSHSRRRGRQSRHWGRRSRCRYRCSRHRCTLRRPVGRTRFFQAAAAAQGVGDDPLELAVDRAELVGSPLLQCIHRCSIDTKYETLVIVLFSHSQLNQWCRVPAFTTGWAASSAQSTTSKFDTIAALRSSSNSTICSLPRRSSAM